jgi:Fe-S cluster assembly protein SufD
MHLTINPAEQRQLSFCDSLPDTLNVTLERSAQLDLLLLASATCRVVLSVTLREASTLKLFWIALGGDDVALDAHVELQGDGATCMVYGFSTAAGDERHAASILVSHTAGSCTSRQLLRQVAAGRAVVDFAGRVVVAQNAQHTDAQQSCKTLLLSSDAHVNAKPQLEIYADDVKCSHGATVGQLDPEQLFYLRSRGVESAHAQQLLLLAFADEVLQPIPNPSLQSQVAARVAEVLMANCGAQK